MKKKPKLKAITAIKIVDFNGQKLELPTIDKPECEALFKTLFERVLAICEKNGIKKESIVIGLASDSRPNQKTSEFFAKIAPYARWQLWTHGRGEAVATDPKYVVDGHINVGIYSHPYVPDVNFKRIDFRLGGWDEPFPMATSGRNALPAYGPLEHWRMYPSGVTVGNALVGYKGGYGSSGIAHVCLDYWPLEQANWAQYYDFLTLSRNNSKYLIAPGPRGPVGTVRLEMLREGLAELEARITLEKALGDKGLTASARKQIEDFLRNYVTVIYNNRTFKGGHFGGTLGAKNHVYHVAKDWRQATTALYDLAAKFQK